MQRERSVKQYWASVKPSGVKLAKLMLANDQLQRSPFAIQLTQRILKQDSEAEKQFGFYSERTKTGNARQSMFRSSKVIDDVNRHNYCIESQSEAQ